MTTMILLNKMMDNLIGQAPPPATALVHPTIVWVILKNHYELVERRMKLARQAISRLAKNETAPVLF